VQLQIDVSKIFFFPFDYSFPDRSHPSPLGKPIRSLRFLLSRNLLKRSRELWLAAAKFTPPGLDVRHPLPCASASLPLYFFRPPPPVIKIRPTYIDMNTSSPCLFLRKLSFHRHSHLLRPHDFEKPKLALVASTPLLVLGDNEDHAWCYTIFQPGCIVVQVSMMPPRRCSRKDIPLDIPLFLLSP